jgi:hypothetical protein
MAPCLTSPVLSELPSAHLSVLLVLFTSGVSGHELTVIKQTCSLEAVSTLLAMPDDRLRLRVD